MKFFSLVTGAAVTMLLAAMPADAAGEAKNPPNMGQLKEASFKDLTKDFAAPDKMYAPFMFWFWDEPLNPAKMAEMSRVMSAEGFNPGYAHGRRSMVGTPNLPDDQWLGDAWFTAFGAALKEAEKQKSYLGYCDEYWWPSFRANGRLLKAHPELRAESLRWDVIDAPGGSEVKVPSSFVAVAAEVADAPDKQQLAPGKVIIRSASLALIGSGEAFTWKAPAGKPWRVYVFNRFFHPGAWDGQDVNAIDERLGKAFIDIALEPYAKRMGDKLGKTIPGDFIDHEGDYGWQLAWSESLDRRYKERYKRDIRQWLPLMLDTDVEGAFAKARWEWYDLVSDLYCQNFKEVTAWHEKRGMYTTGHVWEESLPAQVGCVGDHLKFLRSLTMPGDDCLVVKALFVHDFKEACSVAAFEGKRSMTELMGSAGWGAFNPVFLKQSVNAITAWGVGHIIPHGTFTQRKLSGNPWMPDFYNENPIFPWLHLWNSFATRASYITSLGHAAPDVLLYNPLESAWMLSSIDMVDVDMWTFSERNPAGVAVNAIDRSYSKAMADLTSGRVEYLVGDRHYLAQMQVDGPSLVRGPLVFRTLVLPPLRILSLDSARKMLAFAKAGGRVYALGELPTASVERGLGDKDMAGIMRELSLTPGFTRCADEPAGCRSQWGYGPGWVFHDDASGFGLAPHIASAAPGLKSPLRFVSGGFPMLQARRKIEGRDFFWLVNNSESKQVSDVVISGVSGAASLWDCETGEVRPVSSVDGKNGSNLKLSFKPLEAYWLVFDPKSPAQTLADRPQPTPLMTVEGAWKVTFDPAIQPVMEFPSVMPDAFKTGVEKPLEDWKAWGPAKFSGLMEYTKTIQVAKVSKRMLLDLGKVCHAAEVWVNGKKVGEKLWAPYLFDVSGAVCSGNNVIRIRVANLIDNSYGDAKESGLMGPVIVLEEKTLQVSEK